MKKFFILFSLVISSILLAQDDNQTSQLNLNFNHLALSVKDLNRSVNFYKDILHLRELSREARVKGVRWFSFGEGKELHLISNQYYKADTVITNKAIHLALTTNNFDGLLKSLDTKNVIYGDWDGVQKKITIRSDGVKQIYLQDPDGYWIEINSVNQNRMNSVNVQGVLAEDNTVAIKQTVADYYTTYFVDFDKQKYRSLLTEDYLLLENGELFNIEDDIALMPTPESGYKRTDAFDFRSVKIHDDIAYAVYFLKSEIKDKSGTHNRKWLESITLRRSDEGWKIALLHSTKIPKPEN